MTTIEAKQLTAAAIIFGGVFAIIFDLVMIRLFGAQASISCVASAGFRYSSFGFAMFLFGLGMLVGHLFPSS